jgi:hypothetical protein
LTFVFGKTSDTLLRRLHEANFVQGSMYENNIRVQPGPLTLRESIARSTSRRTVSFNPGLYGIGVYLLISQALAYDGE